MEGILNVVSLKRYADCYLARAVVRLLQSKFSNQIRYNSKDTVIFSSFGGSSWHRADANFIFWVCLDLFFLRLRLIVISIGRRAYWAAGFLWLSRGHCLHCWHMGGR